MYFQLEGYYFLWQLKLSTTTTTAKWLERKATAKDLCFTLCLYLPDSVIMSWTVIDWSLLLCPTCLIFTANSINVDFDTRYWILLSFDLQINKKEAVQ